MISSRALSQPTPFAAQMRPSGLLFALGAALCARLSAADNQAIGGEVNLHGKDGFKIIKTGGKGSVCKRHEVKKYCMRTTRHGSMHGVSKKCGDMLTEAFRDDGPDTQMLQQDSVSAATPVVGVRMPMSSILSVVVSVRRRSVT